MIRVPYFLFLMFFVGLSVSGSAFLTGGYAQLSQNGREIRIASEGARPPYNYFEENNVLAGFEIDLARELCKRIKAKCTFVTQDWDFLIPDLLSKKYDAIFAAMEITEERLQQIGFSKVYVRMPSAFLVKKQTSVELATPNGLAKFRIGVQADGPHEAYLRSQYSQSRIKTYANAEEAMLDLAIGRLDVVLSDEDALETFIKTWPEGACCKILAEVPRDPAYFGEGIGIGLRKEDTELKGLFDKALDETIADGTFAKLRSRYFDFEIR